MGGHDDIDDEIDITKDNTVVNITNNPISEQEVSQSSGKDTSGRFNRILNSSRNLNKYAEVSKISVLINYLFFSSIRYKTSHFFKVEEAGDASSKDRALWQRRRNRMLARTCGKLKPHADRTIVSPSTGGDVTDSAGDLDIEDEDEDIAPKPAFKLAIDGMKSLRRRMTVKRSDTMAMDDVIGNRIEVDAQSPEATAISYSLPVPYTMDISQVDGKVSRSSFGRHQPKGATSKSMIRTFKASSGSPNENEIPAEMVETIADNSNRKLHGVGLLWQILDNRFRGDLSEEEKLSLHSLDDHRPFFTYWITTVQIVVMIIALCTYGFGPWGMTRVQRSGKVLVESLSLQQVDYFEPENFWLGPRAADLIHLGAKYAPCMRKDKNIYEEIIRERRSEKFTGCCIRNDDSGCVQTTQQRCSSLLSTWRKWNPYNPGPSYRVETDKPGHYEQRNRTSGAVCGQDPQFCEDPSSIMPYEWPDDITKWPVSF